MARNRQTDRRARQHQEYQFVAYPERDGRRRRAPNNACHDCKRRRKRCTHRSGNGPEDELFPDTDLPPSGPWSEAEPIDSYSEPYNGVRLVDDEFASGDDTRATNSHSRFVGDLNPEASLVVESQTPWHRDRHDVGSWLQHGQHTVSPTTERANSQKTFRQRQKSGHKKYANDTYCGALPPADQLAVLVDIFFDSVHPLIPAVNEKDFDIDQAPPMLLQAMCITAAKDPGARAHLRLQSSGPSLTPSQFAAGLYEDVILVVGPHFRHDRLLLIQTLVLLSLHPEGSDGAEACSTFLVQAVHHAQTIGLHLDHGRQDSSAQYLKRLFWCIWSLDKFNTAMNGRPRMIHDHDVGLKMEECVGDFAPPFRVWVTLAALLDRVIDFYGPHVGPDVAGWEDGFPSFSRILVDAGCVEGDFQTDVLVSLELVYHGISVLSSRAASRGIRDNSANSSCRRLFSASHISALISHLWCCQLVNLPIMPYSISLAMLVAYQCFRQASHPTAKAVAEQQLTRCQAALEVLADTWSSAGAVARVGRRLLLAISSRAGQATHERLLPSSTAERNYDGATGGRDNGKQPMYELAQPRSQIDAGQVGMSAGAAAAEPLPFDSTFADMDAFFDSFMDINNITDFEINGWSLDEA